jgi:hypothetical protein
MSISTSGIPPLFRKPIYKDLTIWLAGFFVASRSEMIASEYYTNRMNGADGFLGMIFDSSVALAFSGTVFGLVPALLRRRRALKRESLAKDFKELATSRYWILMVGIALIANIWALGNLSDEGESRRQCEQRENAKFCVEMSTLGPSEKLIKTSYRFTEPSVISGRRALGFEYTVNLDCAEGRGRVVEIASSGFSGSSLPISIADRREIVDEILREDVPSLLRRLC